MKVGFTGTRDGLTCEQHAALCEWVKARKVTEFHHGCCVGADSEAFDVFHKWAPGVKIVAHPPESNAMVSGNALEFSDEKRERAPYLDRNRNIVNSCEVLVACPKGEEERRSGTWQCVRYGRRQGKTVYIVWPSGIITVENTGCGVS